MILRFTRNFCFFLDSIYYFSSLGESKAKQDTRVVFTMVKEVQILHPLEGGGGEEAIGAGLMGGADPLDAEGSGELLESAMHVEMDLHVFQVVEGAEIVLEEAQEALFIGG